MGLRYPALISAVAALMVLFVSNRLYVYPESIGKLPVLTAAHIADPRHAGATFRLEGHVKKMSTTWQGIVIIKMHEPEGDVFIDVPVFPSLGCLPVKPMRGETLLVTGNLGMYSGRPQLSPLSAAHVELVARPADPVSVAVASARIGATLLVGPVTVVAAEFFKSRTGQEHLRLALADTTGTTVAGIMYDGKQTECEVDLLLSGNPFLVMAKVGQFKGAPSLNVQRVLAVSAR